MFLDEFDTRRLRPLVGPHVRWLADDDPNGGGDPPADPPADPPEDPPADPEKARLIAESKKYRQRAQAAEAALEKTKAKVLSDDEQAEYERLRAEAKDREDEAAKLERERLEKQGEFEKLVAQKDEKHAKELEAREKEKAALQEALESVVVTDRLKGHLAAAGVKLVDQAAFLLQGQFEAFAVAQLKDGKPVLRVVDRQGQPVTDADCQPGQTISCETLVKQFLASPAGQVFLPPSKDSGSGAHAGGEGPDVVDIGELEANPTKRAEFVQKHGHEEYLKLLGAWKRKRKQPGVEK